MKTFLSDRYFAVRTYEDLNNKKSLNSIVVFELPVEEQVDLDEITTVISSITNGADGYSVLDSRSKFEQGASSLIQRVILDITTSSNTTFDIVKKLYSWAKNNIKNSTNTKDDGDDKYYKFKVSELIENDFGFKMVEFKTLKSSKDSVMAMTLDEGGNRYTVKTSLNGRIIEIEKKCRKIKQSEGMEIGKGADLYDRLWESMTPLIQAIPKPSTNQQVDRRKFMETISQLTFRLNEFFESQYNLSQSSTCHESKIKFDVHPQQLLIGRYEAFYQQMYSTLSMFLKLLNAIAPIGFKEMIKIKKSQVSIESFLKECAKLEKIDKKILKIIQQSREYRSRFIDHCQINKSWDFHVFGIDEKKYFLIYFRNDPSKPKYQLDIGKEFADEIVDNNNGSSLKGPISATDYFCPPHPETAFKSLFSLMSCLFDIASSYK